MKQTTLKLLNNAVLETLEGREMMSATPLASVMSLRNGILTVNGNATTGSKVHVDYAQNKSELAVSVQGQSATFPISQIKQIAITTGSGADNITINSAIDIPADIHSGDGNDVIHAGAGDDTIIAGSGNDLVYTNGGKNMVRVGNGNDKIYGGAGNETFTVGNGNDSLVGGGGTDVMTAGNGNDTFDVGNGHDSIKAGTGHDEMIGGLGNTYLYGQTTATSAADTTTKTLAAKTATLSLGSPTSGSGSSAGSGAGTAGGTASNSGTIAGTTSGSTAGSTGTTAAGMSTAPILGVTNPTGTQKPTAVIKALAGPRVTGLSVNVDGLTSTVGEGSPISTNYAWNFGDAGTAYNQLTGFSAAHVYDQPGTYTIKLTVTNDSGLVSTSTQTVIITASVRNQIYVNDSTGSDSNTGTSTSPLRSLTAAFNKMADNTEILLCAGQTFDTDVALHVNNKNVLIGRYGTGANPTIIRLVGNGLPTISSYSNTNGLTIQDITFDSIYGVSANQAAPKNSVGGIFVGGQNVAVRDCTFLNVDDAINGNAIPTGVLVQGNSAPLTTGVRGYFVWCQGSQYTIVGNYAANSTREHIVRAVDIDEITVDDNNFTNLNRQNVDQYDFSKGCIEIHRGQYAWVVGNTIADGDIRVGPLGLFGEAASSATDYSVIEDNQLTDTFIYVQSGTHHSMIADNVINTSGLDGAYAIVINGTDSQGRTSDDINIVNNTAVTTGTDGNFLRVFGWASNITLENNLWVAPNISIGDHSTAPVYVSTSDLSGFTEISGNVWPSPSDLPGYVKGGINYVGSSSSSADFQTPAEWNTLKQVGTDLFENVKLANSYQLVVSSVTAGADIKIAA